jgi:hypothetical protein
VLVQAVDIEFGALASSIGNDCSTFVVYIEHE